MPISGLQSEQNQQSFGAMATSLLSLWQSMANSHFAGILSLAKPTGMTSRAAVDAVVRVAGTGRVGHAGTLDPLASGVLVVCIGWTTRLVPCIQSLRKRYRGEFRLGCTSDTDDVTGLVIENDDVTPPECQAVASALQEFVGRIRQVPPDHSAVHVGGRRAYELARRGQTVEIDPREVEVHRLELVEYEFPRLVLEIECGSGTYVRSIGRDLGERLGCGAVMSGLVRTAVGGFTLERSVSPDLLSKENLPSFVQPALAAVEHLARFCCPAERLTELRQGKLLPGAGRSAVTPGELTAIVDPEGRLVALAEFDGKHRAFRPRQVFPSPEPSET